MKKNTIRKILSTYGSKPVSRPRKVVECDPYSVIPSVAVLSAGLQTDPRLQHSGDDVNPSPNVAYDPIALAQASRSYLATRQRYVDLINKKISSQKDPSVKADPSTE